MRKKKTRLELYSLYDHTGIAAHLECMAAQGWLLEKIGTWGWTYRQCEPKQVRFAVTYFPKASAYEAGPSEGELTFRAYCEEAGWILAASSAQLQVFYHEDPNCTPMETDAPTQVENIHEAGKKTFLLSNFLFLGLSIFEILVVGLTNLTGNTVKFFTDGNVFFSMFIWCILLVLSTVELVTYYRWRKKALRLAEEEERFLSTKSHPWMQAACLIVVAVGYVLWLLSMQNGGMAVYALIMFAAMMILIAVVNGTRILLKKLKVSKTANKVITIAVDVVLAFSLVFGMTYWAVTSGIGRRKPVDTYDYHGREREVYADPLPLYVDDLMETEREDYSCEVLQDNRSPFGWAYIAEQNVRRDREDQPGMGYYIAEVYGEGAFAMCWKDRLDAYGGVTTPEEMKEPWDGGLVAVDPAPWQADEAYQQYRDREPNRIWLIRWGNRFVKLDLDWEPTPEQMQIIAEKLLQFEP